MPTGRTRKKIADRRRRRRHRMCPCNSRFGTILEGVPDIITLEEWVGEADCTSLHPAELHLKDNDQLGPGTGIV